MDNDTQESMPTEKIEYYDIKNGVATFTPPLFISIVLISLICGVVSCATKTPLEPWEKLLKATSNSDYSVGFATISIAISSTLLFNLPKISDWLHTLPRYEIVSAWCYIYLIYIIINAAILGGCCGAYVRMRLTTKVSPYNLLSSLADAIITILLGLIVVTGLLICMTIFRRTFAQSLEENFTNRAVANINEKDILCSNDIATLQKHLQKRLWLPWLPVILPIVLLPAIALSKRCELLQLLFYALAMADVFLIAGSLIYWWISFERRKELQKAVDSGGFIYVKKSNGEVRAFEPRATNMSAPVFLNTHLYALAFGLVVILAVLVRVIWPLETSCILKVIFSLLMCFSICIAIYGEYVAYRRPPYRSYKYLSPGEEQPYEQLIEQSKKNYDTATKGPSENEASEHKANSNSSQVEASVKADCCQKLEQCWQKLKQCLHLNLSNSYIFWSNVYGSLKEKHSAKTSGK